MVNRREITGQRPASYGIIVGIITTTDPMSAFKARRWKILLALLAVATAASVVLLQVGLRALKSQVEKALGPDSEVAQIRIGWGAVEVFGLRLRGDRNWPARDTLRARYIRVEPELRSLLTDRIQVSSITVDDAYVSALRSADGRLVVVPSLLKNKAAKSGGTVPNVIIGQIQLRNSALDFFDATVAKPPLKISLERLNASVDNIELPGMTARTTIDVDGMIKGRQRDGRVSVKGWMELANLDSAIASHFRDVDLSALQPYLIKAADTGIRSGSLDLDLDSTIEDRRLHAPGVVTLRNLELDEGGKFLGFARQTALQVMKNAQDKMTIHFVLEGDLDDPKFDLNENLATRFASGVTETLGVSVEGVAKGVGSLSEKSLEAAGTAAGGLGRAVKSLFGK